MPNDNPEEDQEFINRPRGVITADDRKFLAGEKELGDQGSRDARYRIRKRIQDSILDLHFLFHELEERDYEHIFKEYPSDSIILRDSIGFFFKGLDTASDSPNDTAEVFEKLLEQSINNSLVDSEYLLNNIEVEINIDSEIPDISELLRKFDREDESLEEFMYLLRNDLIEDQEDMSRRLFQHVKEGTLTLQVEQQTEDGESEYKKVDSENADRLLNEMSDSTE